MVMFMRVCVSSLRDDFAQPFGWAKSVSYGIFVEHDLAGRSSGLWCNMSSIVVRNAFQVRAVF